MTLDFEEHRGHLRAVAYQMLGSAADAEDALQEAWLRLERASADEIVNPRGWLTTVVSRVCLDLLRARAARREEPAAETGSDHPVSPPHAEEERRLLDSVGEALLVMMDRLEPAERVAFVLHDLFEVPFAEIATVVGRSPEAARQLASRARRRVRGAPPPEALAEQRELVQRFVTALRGGDVAGLVAILDPDVVVRFGGAVPELRGAERAATQWAKGATAFAQYADLFEARLVDGAVGLVMAPKGTAVRALRFTFAGGRIAAADIVADRAELAELDVVELPAP